MVGLCLAARPARAATTDPVEPAKLEAFLDGLVEGMMTGYHLPGVAVVIIRNNQIVLSKGYGYADLETGRPVDPETTLFRVGSVSKLFTWTAIMQLVEAGKLDLDADINTYLDFRIPATFPEPITLRHLLSHTTGFDGTGRGMFVLRPERLVPLGQYVKAQLPQRVFPPGTVMGYSNYAASLAGYIVERVSGMSFSDYIRENILKPLGMRSSTFEQVLPPELAERLAGGYTYAEGQQLKAGFIYVVGAPTGGMSTTATDLARFMLAHLNGGSYQGGKILSPETTQRMHAPLWKAHPKLTRGMAHGFFLEEVNGQRVLWHGGSIIQYHTLFMMNPEAREGLVVMMNGSGGESAVHDLYAMLLNYFYPSTEQPSMTPPTDFASRAAFYQGTYYDLRSNSRGVEKLGSALQTTNVEVRDGRVYVSGAFRPGGRVETYVETEPGVLVNTRDPNDRLVLKTEGGLVRLAQNLPWELIRQPDEVQLMLLLFLVAMLGGALLALSVVVRWSKGLIRDVRQRARLNVSHGARLVGIVFSALFLLEALALASSIFNVIPEQGASAVFFNELSPLVELTAPFGFVQPVLALALVVFSGLAWARQWWSPLSRLFYTLVAVWSVAVVGTLAYWNLLLPA